MKSKGKGRYVMDEKNKVVHFGCGALGRGLVIPLLTESGKEVTAVDTNETVLEILKEQKGYDLLISDQGILRHIPVRCAVSSITEGELLQKELRETSVITTSVKRENLKYLVKPILEAWGQEDGTGKLIICCENVEHAGTCFQKLLMEQATEKQKENVKKFQIPNTIVDRICSMDSEAGSVVSESFYELSVDQRVVPETKIRQIDSVDNIEGHFYRKRYLLNSYADAASFLAKKSGYHYLYEAVTDTEIERTMQPFMELLKSLLHETYHIPEEELEQWQTIYKRRLSNEKIPRELSTVARNLWGKLALEERFVKPLLQQKKNGHDITDGLYFIKTLMGTETEIEEMPKDQVLQNLETLWGINEEGSALFQEFSVIYKEK